MAFRSSDIAPLSLVALLAALTSCKSVVDIEVPAQPPALALYSFINPDESIQVDVYRTAGMDEPATTDALRVTDALVTVVSQARRDTLFFSSEDQGYRGGPFPAPGETYRVEVSRPGFVDVHAESTVPARPPITVRTRKVGQDEQNAQYEIALSIDDPVGEHYYRIGCYAFIPPDERFRDTEWQEVFFSSPDLILRENPADVGGQRLESQPQVVGTVYVSDATFEGTTKQFMLHVDVQEWELPFQAKLVVTSMGKDYFAYHRDLELQRRNTDDPFAEPVALFSNVDNGEGILGSYANTTANVLFQ